MLWEYRPLSAVVVVFTAIAGEKQWTSGCELHLQIRMHMMRNHSSAEASPVCLKQNAACESVKRSVQHE